jgi:hypothetical protein
MQQIGDEAVLNSMGWDMSDANLSGYASLTRPTSFRLYRLEADRWWLIDNAAAEGQRLIATGGRDAPDDVVHPSVWNRFLETHR